MNYFSFLGEPYKCSSFEIIYTLGIILIYSPKFTNLLTKLLCTQMIILEEPYVSDFLQKTLQRLKIPVLKNQAVNNLNLSKDLNFLSANKFIEIFRNNTEVPVYCPSENGLDWIIRNFGCIKPELANQINIFKDKFRLRTLLKPVFPNFRFEKVKMADLSTYDVSSWDFPLIVKPNIGFFSVAVYRVDSADQWNETVENIITEFNNMQDVFPATVLDNSNFILESFIEGDEYAVDVYFNDKSEPVILNVMQHIFAGPKDTSDRLYITSKEIIEHTLDPLTQILTQIGQISEVKRFPLHTELRISKSGEVGIIEVNPMRFAGLCVTDLAYFAYGSNNYELFFNQQAPDWDRLLTEKEGKIYAMILGTLPRDLPLEKVESVDYQSFCTKFSHVLECREMDVHKIPLFTITFAEFDESTMDEMDWALHSDFREFFKLKRR